MASSVGSRVIPVEVILWSSGGRSLVADRDLDRVGVSRWVPTSFPRMFLGRCSVMASSIGSRTIPVGVILWLSGGSSPVADPD